MDRSKMIKISVIGDIMCEAPVLQQAKRTNGYNFRPIFAPMKALFSESDLVVGNLETPLAGEEAGYSPDIFSFNAPDSLAADLKDIGIGLVSTANNHTFDRGMDGLTRTIKVLDDVGLLHTGTAVSSTEDRTAYLEINGTKLAFIAATYGVNETPKDVLKNNVPIPNINMLKPFRDFPTHVYEPEVVQTRAYIEEKCGCKMSYMDLCALKHAMGIPVPYADDWIDPNLSIPYLDVLEKDYQDARKSADLVFFLPHTGGQFNTKPGEFSRFMVTWALSVGFDAVLAAHSHTTQMAQIIHRVPCFYSLGNVTMSPNTSYAELETLPEYGLAAHLYLSDKKVAKTTFSVFKIVEDPSTPLYVIPVDELHQKLDTDDEKKRLEKDVAEIYTRVTGRSQFCGIEREYDL